jgi:hypothetical protein
VTTLDARSASPADSSRGKRWRAPIAWGVVWGIITAAVPLGVWWLDPASVYALAIVLIAAVYIGFAVADGRWTVLLVESGVAAVFVVIAATAIIGPVWLLVVGYAGHGFKDLWQHRTHYVANTRWWPPFCCVVDWIAAVLISGEIVAGVHFHH